MKKKDSYFRFPVMGKSMSLKPKRDLLAFLKKIQLPKLNIKLPSFNFKGVVKGTKTPIGKQPKKAERKKFKFSSLVGGLRGRIILLVLIMTLIPLGFLNYSSTNSQTSAIMSNMDEFNKAVNQGLIERINAIINQSLSSLKLVPQSVDILAMDTYSQERVIRKIASSQQSSFKEITLTDAAGKALYSTNAALRGTDLSGQRWYTEAMRGQNFISDSYLDSKLHVPAFDISVPVFDQNNSVAGVMQAKIVLDEIQAIINSTKIGKTGIAYIIDKNGVVIAHPDYKAMVLSGYNAVQNFIQGPVKLIKGEQGTSHYDNNKGVEVIGTYYKIPVTGWGLITETGVKEALEPVNAAKRKSYVVIAIAFAIAVVGSLLLAVLIVKPLVNMAKVAGEIKDGNLRKRLSVTSKDEIGELQNAFNLMTDSLCTVINEVNSAVAEITEASRKLSENAQVSTAATEEITAIVEDVAGGAESQIASVSITSQVAREITANVEETSKKTQIVADNAEGAARIAQEGTENIGVITNTISMIKDNVVNSASLVRKLGSTSAEVTGIVKVIRDIAGKTNMLALNAAIEAARAGDAGKGFAVVANEIRSLAEQTRAASKNIEELLMEIQKETEETVTAMNEGLQEVEKGTEAISSTYSTFDRIINEIHSVAEEVRGVSNSVLDLSNESRKVIDAVNEVSTIAESTSKGTQNVLASTEEQSSAVQEINSSASKLSKMAAALQEIVNKFTC
ncbi:MAG: methyl-accepting chemotaxis protein [Caulobacteraceae bacterium]